MKTFKINVEIAWNKPGTDNSELYNHCVETITVRANNLAKAQELAEDKAMNNHKHDLGRPDYACVV